MRTKLTILMLLPTLVMANVAHAQNLGADVDSELDQLYSAQATTTSQNSNMNSPMTATQPIYILNQATPNQSQQGSQAQVAVQKQPTTIIEASPLHESRADMMRKARVDAEGQTETRIVEKLEQSRMEDEKRRASVLFGDKFSQLEGNQNTNVQQTIVTPGPVTAPVQVAPAQVQQAPVAPVIVAPPAAQAEEKESTRDIVREEIRSALETEEEAPVEPLEQRYFGGTLGIGQYPDVKNVEGNYSMGFTFGTKFDNSYAVEGSFIYSNYTIDGRWVDAAGFIGQRYQDVNQYAGALALKYYFFSGMVKPVMGGVLQYSYRQYGDSDQNQSGSYRDEGGITSHAVDLGAILGADVQLSPRTSIGLDVRYMFNMSNRKNYPSNTFRTVGTDLESLNYYVMGITANVNF